MKNRFVFLCMMLLIFLAACNNGEQSAEVDIKSLINDYSTDQKEAVSASVNATQLLVDNGEQQEQYELPEDEFFVSIAPFVEETHPCTYHSLTGCQGELANTAFDVYIEDVDGNVIIDETIESFDNGFFDIWLPRNQAFNAKISFDGKEVEAPLSTYEDDATCITSMQLS
ncbi:CueP family metal-binding protein [Gracilibacillus alcaliphilus]|uniref:CueP family metal-binding protein n=1 Tax=Gracilibacillus alcaliphilus TaxID=1401441 RepID=UPI001EF791C6|nr:CueP family metal-binding protein [Gracilibacillus alcaliphilus]MBM7675545.1 hypothetical protein [Gracilibacillus alcaliphilus]